MLVSIKDGVINNDGFTMYCYEENVVYINGFIFLRGKHAGKESLDIIAREYFYKGSIDFDRIYGAYSIVLCKYNCPMVLFSDNSCMQGFFIGKEHIGSRLNEIAIAENAHSLNMREVCRCLTLTRGFGRHTIIEGIEITNNLCYYEVSEDRIVSHEKGIDDISGKSTIRDPFDFFKDISYALSGNNAICALTGGYDSRAVLSLLNSFNPISSFISGDNYASKEIIYSKKAAEAGNINHWVIAVDKPTIEPDWIMSHFFRNNGIYSDFCVSGWRGDNYLDEIKKAGYDMALTGDAGDMHKELWFVQDFPFYNRRKTNISKFYSLRIEIISYRKYLGKTMLPIYKAQKQEIVKQMSSMTKQTNTQSYSVFGWEVAWVQSAKRNTEADRVIIYPPFQEIDLVRYSFHLPRRKLFFNKYLRDLTTCSNRDMARIPTVYGTSASNETLFIVRDILMQVLNFAKKIVGMISRKIIRRNVLAQSACRWSFEDEIRSWDMTSKALTWCKKEGYLSNTCNVDDLPIWILNRALDIWLTEEMVLSSQRTSTVEAN